MTGHALRIRLYRKSRTLIASAAITNLDLNGADSYQTIVGMVADAAAKAAPGQVIKDAAGIRQVGFPA